MICRLTRTKFFFWLAYPHAEADIYSSRQGVARYRWLYRVRGYFRSAVLYRWILPAADHVFVQSEQMGRDLAGHGVDSERMTAVPSSVSLARHDVSDLLPWRDRLQAYGKRVVYFGTLQRERKLDFMVRAFRLVLDRHPDAILDVLGRGNIPEDERLVDDEIDRLGIGKSVVRHGFVPAQDAGAVIKRAAVCLSPYYCTEILLSTSPTKLVEYLAYGRPVVATDHPEQKQVLAEFDAGLSASWNEKEFAGAICEILDDPERGEAMGRRGRAFVEAERTDERLADVVEQAWLRKIEGCAG